MLKYSTEVSLCTCNWLCCDMCLCLPFVMFTLPTYMYWTGLLLTDTSAEHPATPHSSDPMTCQDSQEGVLCVHITSTHNIPSFFQKLWIQYHKLAWLCFKMLIKFISQWIQCLGRPWLQHCTFAVMDDILQHIHQHNYLQIWYPHKSALYCEKEAGLAASLQLQRHLKCYLRMTIILCTRL